MASLSSVVAYRGYTLIIPAAGESARYASVTSLPKGLTYFRHAGRWDFMLKHVLSSARQAERLIVGVRAQDIELFSSAMPRMVFTPIAKTRGQADTVQQLAWTDTGSEDILILNCDNAFEPHVIDNFVQQCRHVGAECGAVVFKPSSSNQRKYGYVDGYPFFETGAEAVPLSHYALAGAFYYKSSSALASSMPVDAVYLSETFKHVRGTKLAHLIKEHQLYEWGTPQDLEASVGKRSIVWRNHLDTVLPGDMP